MPMRKTFLTALALALLAALPAAAADPAALTVVPEIRAQLSPKRSTVIASEVPGKVAELPFRDGDRFEKGQVLAGLDCSLTRTRLAAANATREKLERVHETKAQLNRMQSVGRLDVDVAAADLAQAEAEASLMRQMVERCTVTAPFAGRVAEVKAKRWQFVREGEPLVEILDDRDLEVEMIVPSRWLRGLREGSAFTLALEETGRTYAGKVTRLSGRVDPVNQSIRLYGELEGKHPELMAGMSGRALFDGAAQGVPGQ